MNIFGAFTFGSLIKTFLPGFVWLIAFMILLADGASLVGFKTDFSTLATVKDPALILAIPVSILLGLLSNVIVFMGMNDRLVRNQFSQREPRLFALHGAMVKRLRQQCWDALAHDDLNHDDFIEYVDPEVILLERLGVDKLAYVREQYWYHLEFQLNLMLSLIAGFFALAVASIINADSCMAIPLALLWIVVGVLVSYWLLRAARKNYCRHIAKMASLMTALLCPAPEVPKA